LPFYKGTPEGWHYYRERHYWKGRRSVAEGGTLLGCPFVWSWMGRRVRRAVANCSR